MKKGIRVIYARFALLLLAAVMLFASGCDQKAPPAQTSVPTAAAKPSAALAATAQIPDETKVDMSMDLINITEYFGKITKQVKTEWKSDARMISVRADFRGKDFMGLMKLRTDYDYLIIYYSLGSKTELRVEVNNAKKDASGHPELKYGVAKKDMSTKSSMTLQELKSKSDFIFDEYSRPETYSINNAYPENYFEGWKMKMSDVVKALIVRSKTEKITGIGFNITFNYNTQVKTPQVSMYWENGTAKTYFYIEPITGNKYDKAL